MSIRKRYLSGLFAAFILIIFVGFSISAPAYANGLEQSISFSNPSLNIFFEGKKTASTLLANSDVRIRGTVDATYTNQAGNSYYVSLFDCFNDSETAIGEKHTFSTTQNGSAETNTETKEFYFDWVSGFVGDHVLKLVFEGFDSTALLTYELPVTIVSTPKNYIRIGERYATNDKQTSIVYGFMVDGAEVVSYSAEKTENDYYDVNINLDSATSSNAALTLKYSFGPVNSAAMICEAKQQQPAKRNQAQKSILDNGISISLSGGKADKKIYIYKNATANSPVYEYVFHFSVAESNELNGPSSTSISDVKILNGQMVENYEYLQNLGWKQLENSFVAILPYKLPYNVENARFSFCIPENTEVYIGDIKQDVNDERTCTIQVPADLTTPAPWNKPENTTVVRVQGSAGYSEEYTEYRFTAYGQTHPDMPTSVVDYLCIGSQYTNGERGDYFGLMPIRSIRGLPLSVEPTATSPTVVSLGNYGGYITYFYETPLTDDSRNPYGIDFLVHGNSYNGTEGYSEPGQVWVSENGVEWFALAGSIHYDDNCIWDYQVTYKNNLTWLDNKGHSGSISYAYPQKEFYPLYAWPTEDAAELAVSGIYLTANAGKNEYGNTLPPYPAFGYADVHHLSNTNVATNPYAKEGSYYDTFDLAWAVDAHGNPVDVGNKEFHYVKVQTASFIINSSIGEKSTEVSMMRLAQPADSDVGQTDAPTALTIDGQSAEVGDTGSVYNMTVSDPFSVKVTAPTDANVYINGERTTFRKFDKIPMHGIIRVIVQEGEKAPWIGYYQLSEGTSGGETVTLSFKDGDSITTDVFDASLDGYALPTLASTAAKEFLGWQYGQKIYTSYVHGQLPDGATLTAIWKTIKEETPKDKSITVSFRLIGSSKSDGDIDLADGNYRGAEYQTWIGTTNYTLPEESTVLDLINVALDGVGLIKTNPSGNYFEGIYAPEKLGGFELKEMTNGPRSGWMYTIGGEHPFNGVAQQELSDGDAVILHYVDDYAYEVADWDKLGGAGYPAMGDSTFHNAWLSAPDLNPDQPGYSGGLPAGSTSTKKDEKKDDAPTSETTTQTVTADDGSTVTTETEKTVETKENDDGSVTEVVTETTKTTVTAPDGSVSTTETAVETETTTNSVKNADGTVTETEQTVKKVTETVTGADGKTQTTVTETEETKKLNTTTGADGKVSGTGTYSATSTVTVDGKKTTAVTEGTVVVDANDKGTVSKVTTAKTTTTAPDGTKTETVTVITEAEMTNGTTGKVVADEQGNTISAEATVSQAAIEAVAKSGEPIEIPVTVNAASGATVSISLEGADEGSKLWVEIGTTETAPGNVAYLKLADGVTKLLTTCKTGSVIVPVTGDCEVIVKDNSKTFTDVEASAWYGNSVKFVTAREIFNGNGDGTFAPAATMNRAMAAQILYNLDGSAKAGDGTSFSDVTAGDWFNGAVGWASGLGVITGYDGAYNPLNTVTRQDLVTILYRYAKAAGYDVSAGRVDLTAYADGAEVASYAADAMRWAIAVGLVNGYEDNTLRPTATATRAEVAAIMQRLVQTAVK